MRLCPEYNPYHPLGVTAQLFVYGTLMPGQRAHWRLASRTTDWRAATYPGWLYAFPGGYPGLLERPGHMVHGQICQLLGPESWLSELDEYEGDEYIRVVRPVCVGASQLVSAWCYVLIQSALAPACQLIESGDWAAYVAGRP